MCSSYLLKRAKKSEFRLCSCCNRLLRLQHHHQQQHLLDIITLLIPSVSFHHFRVSCCDYLQFESALPVASLLAPLSAIRNYLFTSIIYACWYENVQSLTYQYICHRYRLHRHQRCRRRRQRCCHRASCAIDFYATRLKSRRMDWCGSLSLSLCLPPCLYFLFFGYMRHTVIQ